MLVGLNSLAAALAGAICMTSESTFIQVTHICMCNVISEHVCACAGYWKQVSLLPKLGANGWGRVKASAVEPACVCARVRVCCVGAQINTIMQRGHWGCTCLRTGSPECPH
mmetsp:Transcript_71421/g.119569  ORF Transcript_71421/g.119569 Transcript_71421/m.119569 type:complete len:111 (+) Transcript_71421:221-553(+)